MAESTETLKVKSTDPESQGPFVLINAADFDEAVHKLHEPEPEPEPKAAKAKKAAAAPAEPEQQPLA
jgi:hypothetical protein